MGKYVIWILAGALLVTLGGLSGMANSLSNPAAPPPEQLAAYENLLRLHVVANSDTATDQAIKRQVRDAVLVLLTPTLKQARDSQQAKQLVLARREDIRHAAQQVVKQAGRAYDVRVEVGRFAFPTKVYGDTALPAGNYEALRISLGEAQGQNWWCVLFPPLCLVDAAGGVAIAPAGTTAVTGSDLAIDTHDLAPLSDDPDEWPAEVREVAAWGEEGRAAPTIEVRYAFLDWLRRQHLSPGLTRWLLAHGLVPGEAAR